MAGKEEKKKFNRPPTGIKKRNKQTHAQYVWIRDVYCRLDMVDVRLTAIEDFLGLNRKVNKEGNEQSSKVNTP